MGGTRLIDRRTNHIFQKYSRVEVKSKRKAAYELVALTSAVCCFYLSAITFHRQVHPLIRSVYLCPLMPHRTVIVITGASRGLGRAIAVAFASCLSPFGEHIRVILVARSKADLIHTERDMHNAANGSAVHLEIFCCCADLADLSALESDIDNIFHLASQSAKDSDDVPFDRAILINNAGSLGYLGKVRDMASLVDLQHAINLNVTSSIWISSQFVSKFSRRGANCLIVNISSLCAIEPFSTMSVYCSGKAARDMLHTVLAKEESNAESSSEIKILNYAPGMCETEMSRDLCNSDSLDSDLQRMYRKALQEKTMVQPRDTGEKLVQIITANNFESGKHVDFWDDAA